MRDLFKLFMVGIVLFFAQVVFAEEYTVLILPDNIVTESASIDSFIYNETAEFFGAEIVNLLNSTDYIKAPQVSTTRKLFKSEPKTMLLAKELTSRFRTSYNIDYEAVKKLASKSGVRYVLLLTSDIDAENYILRRTIGNFFNIPGASVVDPAYKISTYAALIDTKKDLKLWSDTYYKTISVVENRIITKGPSPQTEQLNKIKDYSRYICPQIAQNVQLSILPPEILAKESNQIDYDIGNIDNVFTKKYRHLGKESKKLYEQKKAQTQEFVEEKKEQINEYKAKKAEERKIKESEAQLNVKARPVCIDGEPCMQKINATTDIQSGGVLYTIFNKKQNVETEFQPTVEIKKTRKNRLFENNVLDQPKLRGYD